MAAAKTHTFAAARAGAENRQLPPAFFFLVPYSKVLVSKSKLVLTLWALDLAYEISYNILYQNARRIEYARF